MNTKKVFEANNELSDILLNKGLIEITSLKDKEKGLRIFKPAVASKKKIYFDHADITVFYGNLLQDSLLELSEEQLRQLLLFCKLPITDFRLVDYSGEFSFVRMNSNMKRVREEVINYRKFDVQESKRRKIENILKVYDNIEVF
ncbi:hypothetical protein LVD17_03120 [Fulvivirga ulvae]|uniref:hypothetical protein n=1 Tax=Fulvivirga ulvae TaxID=2904245 RepID=UPI001F44766F|nr:hypothetical protein [Fulvivirga ulvae]UII32823.1 hypothetical protein LVD17_03120 [Fulvivirga ulvae]